jgi:TnpA family transposase
VRILDDDELAAMYGRPRFTADERIRYFTLSPAEYAVLQLLRVVSSQTAFVLQLGYFRAKQLFFSFGFDEVEADVHYVLNRYFPQTQATELHALNKRTILKQHHLISALFRYQRCGARERQQLEARAHQSARISSKPIYVFRDLIQYLTDQRIVAPGYTILQMIVGRALTYEQHRLTSLVGTLLNPVECAALDQLCAATDGLYPITLLKRAPKDFSLGEMRREMARAAELAPLYHLATRVLPQLAISNENITYYASLVTYYSVFRLQQLDASIVSLYLLCFVAHRYQRLHDNLLNGFIHHVRRFSDAAKEAAKERVYTYRLESNQNLPKAGQILKLFTDDRVDDTTMFASVQAKAFAILDRDHLDRIADYIATNANFDETAFHWDHIDALAHQFKRHLRPILLTVDLAATRANAGLMEAVALLKTAFRKERSLGQLTADTFPTRFIPKTLKRYLYAHNAAGKQQLVPNRYEFLVYRLVRNGLEAGDLFCRDSVHFRSFEDDLVDDQRWQGKDALIAAIGAPLLVMPIQQHLADLEQQLEGRLAQVNQRIVAGENVHFRINQRGRQAHWTLEYPGGGESVNHPLFTTLRPVDIGGVLQFVNQQCQFMAAFEHILGRYVKQEGDDRVISACLVAWGTNMGLGRMGDISDIAYPLLSGTSEHFIRLETLKAANDRVSNAIAAFAIFHDYDLGDVVHSSSDGQKFETSRPTINARDSPKYFGLKKGVVAYTLVANHIPVNARIIGAHDHESHYVFDLLFNNTTDIHPTVHSTDTHGANQVNFALLHLFGYQFAPRYQDFQDRVRTGLYGFQHPRQYATCFLKPIRKLNTDLIVAEWENLQRIFVSLALKTTTQSIIVRKLSAYARKNKTRRALWEYDNIIRSLYFLEYVDSPPLRQNVQRALNRGENYHQLRRAVSYANFGKLRFTTEEDQHLWNECSRLITNCIIYYNATIISGVLAQKARTGDTGGVALVTQVSPVAWQHINFYGRYAFTTGPDPINVDAIIEELAQRSVVPPEEAS